MKILFIIYFAAGLLSAQSYKAWFLFPEKEACKGNIVGIYKRSYKADTSAIERAVFNAAVNSVRYSRFDIRIEEATRTDTKGSMYMGADISGIIDTNAIPEALESLTVIDTMVSKNIVAVLTSFHSCNIYNYMSYDLGEGDYATPAWIDSLPNISGYTYALGISKMYANELSSWDYAEALALKDLVAADASVVKSLQKHTESSAEETIVVESRAVLQNISVAGRWYDRTKQLFYVLLKTPN